jgi:hypothetical protein
VVVLFWPGPHGELGRGQKMDPHMGGIHVYMVKNAQENRRDGTSWHLFSNMPVSPILLIIVRGPPQLCLLLIFINLYIFLYFAKSGACVLYIYNNDT